MLKTMTNKERRSVIRAKSLDQPSKGCIVYELAPGIFYDDAFYLNPYRRTSTFPPDPNNLNFVRISVGKFHQSNSNKTNSDEQTKCCCEIGREHELSNGRYDLSNGRHDLSNGRYDLPNCKPHLMKPSIHAHNNKLPDKENPGRPKRINRLQSMNTVYASIKSENGTAHGAKDHEVETEARILRRNSMRYIGHWYYPEGGWGWIVCLAAVIINIFTQSLLLSLPLFMVHPIRIKFGNVPDSILVLLLWSPLCMGLCVSSVSVYLLMSKPTRVVSVLSAFIIALGFLFASFSTQLHQVFISLSIFVGIGMSVLQNTPTVILHQYFRKKKPLVETLITSTTGFGIPLVGSFLQFILEHFGWRLGCQILSVTMILNIPVLLLFRPASLYHPQRRAMQHIKYHQKKILGRRFLKTDQAFFKDHEKYLKNPHILLITISAFFISSGLYCPFYLITFQPSLHPEPFLHFLLIFGAIFALGVFLSGLMVFILMKKGRKSCFNIKHLVWLQISCLGSGLLIYSLGCYPAKYSHIVDVCLLLAYAFILGAFMVTFKLVIFTQIRRSEQNRIWGLIQMVMPGPILFFAWATTYFHKKSVLTISGVLVLMGGVLLLICNLQKINDLRGKKRRRNCVNALKNGGLMVGLAPLVDAIPNGVEIVGVAGNQDLADDVENRNLEQFLYEDFLSSCDKVEDRINEDELQNNAVNIKFNKLHVHPNKGHVHSNKVQKSQSNGITIQSTTEAHIKKRRFST